MNFGTQFWTVRKKKCITYYYQHGCKRNNANENLIKKST